MPGHSLCDSLAESTSDLHTSSLKVTVKSQMDVFDDGSEEEKWQNGMKIMGGEMLQLSL